MNRKVYSMVAAIALLGTVNASAVDFAPDYIKGGLGYTFMSEQTAEATRGQGTAPDQMKTKFDNMPSLALGVGYNVTNCVNMELTYQYNIKSKSEGMNYTLGGVPKTGAYNMKLQTSTLMLNTLISIDKAMDKEWSMSPYVGFGIGVAQHNISDFEAVGTYYDYRGEKNTNYSLATKATLGAVYDINDNLSLDVSYSLAHYGEAKGDNHWHDSSANTGLQESPITFDVINHETFVSLRYKF
jgi:opacity protein-like surface antigen